MNNPTNLPGSNPSAFYVHFEDALRADPPSSLQRKYPLPRPQQQRMEAAEERRSWLGEQKVEQLSVRLARVALITDRHHRQATQSWQDARNRITRDMDEHVRKRTALISKRLRNLRNHNLEVRVRKDEAKQEKLFRKLTHLYEAKNASTISQFWGKQK
ncbi:uncharacterized protein LOC128255429 [Drosophila gunungcola]|uniref:Uncharacterized protein n=1 Tax=Drosophila gunungcola TaxID=103775 RepID=A0A9P9YJ92_9MUSC|nr:uncharacterized protein LOC128255429 [Drosophila gunungcola]KAI8037598.1 hypothetical protein M5D96_009753 [Drosophila gunungcola]